MVCLTTDRRLRSSRAGPEDLDTESGSESVCRNRFGCGIGVHRNTPQLRASVILGVFSRHARHAAVPPLALAPRPSGRCRAHAPAFTPLSHSAASGGPSGPLPCSARGRGRQGTKQPQGGGRIAGPCRCAFSVGMTMCILTLACVLRIADAACGAEGQRARHYATEEQAGEEEPAERERRGECKVGVAFLGPRAHAHASLSAGAYAYRETRTA